MRFRDRESGQASVELVAVLPALLLCALIAVQLAIVGYGLWSSATAARAGARAAYVNGDAERAARSAVPGALRRDAEVRDGRHVAVALASPSLVPGVDAPSARARTILDPEGGGD
jgi:Flp pilus assembly pilin Flp